MDELAKAIAEAPQHGKYDLQGAAQKWAVHSLETYKDETLKRALAISESLCNFLAELENPSGKGK